jgi:hypothetical protein
VCILKTTRSGKIRVVCFNVGVVFLLLGVFEICLYAQDREMLHVVKQRNRLKGECRNEEGQLISRVKEHDILGYSLSRNQTVFWKKYYENDLVFDVSYSTDSDGLRVSPPWRGESDSASILFFGCSYTFGYGVNDNETVPYLVGLETDTRFRVYNFGLCGYGPHQMLASIEGGMVAEIVENEHGFVIYTALIEHAWRCAVEHYGIGTAQNTS